MSELQLLSPTQAESMVTNLIDRFGLGAVPNVSVQPTADGQWKVNWQGQEHVCAPMTEIEWRGWLEETLGPLSAQFLETSEG